MLGLVVADFGVSVAGLRTEGETLSCGAGRGVSDCEHGDDGADDDGSRTGAASTDQRVAVFVIGLHGHGGHGQVGAVDGDHGGLGETGFGVIFLDSGVDGDEGDDEKNKKVDLVVVRRDILGTAGEMLTVIAAWFIEQPPWAKKMYIMIVMAKEAVNIPSVDPIRMNLQALESRSSIFSRQYSAQECARSTRRITPSRTNSIAPMNAT